MDFHNADGEGFRDGGKFLFADARGWFDGLGPGLEAIVGGEFLAFCHVAVAALIEADDAIDALFFELGEGVEGAKSPVCKEDVFFLQKSPQATEEHGLVNVVVACGEFEQGAAGEREEADEAHEREAATGLLGGGLGVVLLVEGSVWHGDGCAVDDLDMASFPEGVFGGVAFAAVGDVFGDFSPNKSPYQLELRVCPKNPAANQFPDVFRASLATRHRQKPIFPIRQGAGEAIFDCLRARGFLRSLSIRFQRAFRRCFFYPGLGEAHLSKR